VNEILREFMPDDFDSLWQIDQECFPPGISYSRAELAAYLRHPSGFALVAEAGAPPTILGFIVAERNRKGRGHIITIDVIEDGRRSGIGSRLLNSAEARLRCARCDRVRLEVAVDNTAARAFYVRHKYEEAGIIRGYYSNGDDAMVMEKKLSS
jgi:[ribosomal protein S18]-alanine N-acetyltransferase